MLPFIRQATLIGSLNALSASLAINTVFRCAPVGSLGPHPHAGLQES